MNKNEISNGVKTKKLLIIFMALLTIGLAVFLTKEKSEPVLNEQLSVIEKQADPAVAEPVKEADVATSAKEKIIQSEIVGRPPVVSAPAEEKIKAVMIISSAKYEAEIKPGGSAYDLMNLLKNENKINFSGKDYAGLGFFVEEINGVKNNPTGANWLYYVNGRPAPVGVSYYLIKANDIIEWKYEKKSF